jgi:hypothetical protein
MFLGASPATAWAASISRGESLTSIDATVGEAAGITGRVVDAQTAQPLDRIQVCAIEAGGEEFSRCGYTSGDGRYQVAGMPSGEYKVAFSPERYGDEEEAPSVDDGYFAQYYDDAQTRATATVLVLTAPSLTVGINAKLTSRVWNRPNTVILPWAIEIRRHSASFKFLPKPPGSWFECRIDRHPYKRCSSPVTYRHLRAGRHLFEARTVPKVGTAGAPARFKFRIGPRSGGGRRERRRLEMPRSVQDDRGADRRLLDRPSGSRTKTRSPG